MISINRHQIQLDNAYYNPNYFVKESCVVYNDATFHLWQETYSKFVSRLLPSGES